ncbi:ATP synthase subunit H-domain-containing protein [Crucibulum laeve]|uniref:ATP synthase subunit H-domain-containing protein n=1 Tax=Crucibulum laeve TaxID=68775 RepID=A0A5C3LWX6_9AGAR|nr:ATP synthase subunit H-domain-containing protein [Crucibulum laeve]
MSSIFPVIFVLIVTAGLMTLAALFTPKGPHQVTIRTSIMLAVAACYLMWMVTYMAQLHPLIGDSNEDFEDGII